MIRIVGLSDAQAICDIYNEYVKNTSVTFEEIPVPLDEMMGRIKTAMQNYPWLVYEIDGKVVGYTYGRTWRDRAAYRKSVETGTYIDSRFIGKGIGSQLKKELLRILKEKSFHAVISGIALPNPASIALNEKFGFKKVAHFKEVGYKFNKWIDVGYWELIL
ncbi:MAG TPA: GNAT family N-acetyltransferase [Candidatus Acidoferrales bacterium]|nr:GNAT family N-acetyltransferase [Candidatus Acidoferrales bacterium]